MKARLLLLIVGLMACTPAWATTFTAASCSTSDVQTALNSAVSAAHDGDIVSIPACSAGVIWTAGASATFTSSVIIQGAGAISATTGGATTTGADLTVIIDGWTGNQPLLSLTSQSGKSLRITGIAIKQNASGASKYNGTIAIFGSSTAVRFDHCHFYFNNSGDKGIAFWGSSLGVVDHIFFDANPGIITNDVVALNGANWQGSNDGEGHQSWVDTSHFGSSQFVFIEDSNFNYGWVSDCSNGGRFVVRHNTGNHVSGTEEHGTHDQGRGCRALEFYQNSFTGDANVAYGPIASFNAGAALSWGNTITAYQAVIRMDIVRQSNSTYSQSAPPNGWGYCGSAQSGVTSSWDQNTDSSGYACLDQPTRGAGDLLSGNSFPAMVNTVTSGQNWPHQVRDPLYVWNNTYSPDGFASAADSIVINGAGSNIVDNRDYYQQFDNTYGEPGSNCTAANSCNITVGVNQTNRAPVNTGGTADTCTAGPGGNTPGVGWWNTSTNTLWVCNPTNHWSIYYTPFTYPHPLAAGVSFTGGIAFGNVNAGSSSTLSTTLQNTTASSVSIGPFSATPSQFTISTGTGACGSTLGAGSTCTVYVQFSPTAATGYSGTLTEPVSGATASLTGTGTSGTIPPTISWNPASITFLNTNVGVTSYTATTVLSNTGASGSTLNVAISLGGTNAGDFVCTGGTPRCGCPATITSGSCTVTLKFTPSATGTRTASLTETDATASNTPQSASLTGASSCSKTSIGTFTLCGFSFTNGSSVNSVMNGYNPAPGNSILALSDWCAPAGCGTLTDTTTATIGDNINATEACFTVSPHSPYDFQNSNVPDHERLYAWFCPSIPSGVTSFTVTTSAIVHVNSVSIIEFMPGAFAPTSFWETVDTVASSGNVAGSTASVSTNGRTSNANDLIVAELVDCSGSVNMTADPSYTGIIVNPSTDPGRIIEARAVTTPGSYTATATVNPYTSVCCNCDLGAGSPNLTWFGIITPLKGGQPAAGFNITGATLLNVGP